MTTRKCQSFRHLLERRLSRKRRKGANRGRKKCRKALAKLNLNYVEGVERVTMRKSKNVLFVIANLMYKALVAIPMLFSVRRRLRTWLPRPLNSRDSRPLCRRRTLLLLVVPLPLLLLKTPAVVEEEDVDMTGVNPKDVDLVCDQAAVSKKDAVKALKNNDNDIVNAIMELTM